MNSPVKTVSLPWGIPAAGASATEIAATSGTQRIDCPARTAPPLCHDGLWKIMLTPPPEADSVLAMSLQTVSPVTFQVASKSSCVPPTPVTSTSLAGYETYNGAVAE
jgi:hypothetical protein